MKGFTLVETLVYITLFGLLLGGAVISTYHLLDGGGRTTELLRVHQEGMFLTRKLNWEVGHAKSVAVVDGELVLEPGHIVFGEGENVLTLARGAGGEALPLNSSVLPVTAILFTVDPAAGATPAKLRASFVVAGKQFTFERYVSP